MGGTDRPLRRWPRGASPAWLTSAVATQCDFERVLDLVANQVQEAGYRHRAATSLKPKHVEGLMARWQVEGLAVGTIRS